MEFRTELRTELGAESREFNELKKLGFEFRSPQDEFSYQPDSGSIANGLAAKQEYGIDVDTDALTAESQLGALEKDGNLSDVELIVPSRSKRQPKKTPSEKPGFKSTGPKKPSPKKPSPKKPGPKKPSPKQPSPKIPRPKMPQTKKPQPKKSNANLTINKKSSPPRMGAS